MTYVTRMALKNSILNNISFGFFYLTWNRWGDDILEKKNRGQRGKLINIHV